MLDIITKDYQQFLVLEQQLSLYQEHIQTMYQEMDIPGQQKDEAVMRKELFSRQTDSEVQEHQHRFWSQQDSHT